MLDISIVLAALGMNGPDLVAGFFGGLISVFFAKDLSPREMLGILLSGTIFPAYSASVLAELIHLPHAITALFLGYGGIQALRVVYNKYFLSRVGGDKNA